MKREKLAALKSARYVLPTESAELFESERLAFESVLSPNDIIEQMQVEDLVYHNWKISQQRRIAFAIFREALGEVLYDLLVKELHAIEHSDARILINRWVRADASAKIEVLKILEKHGLDEPAIEAEAFVRCSAKLVAIEHSAASHGSRRDKALPSLAFYREMIARQSKQPVDALPEAGEIARFERVHEREDTRGH